MSELERTATSSPGIIKDLRESVELAKLHLEVDELRSSLRWDRRVGRFLSVLGSLVLVAGFWAGLWQYSDTKAEEFRRRFWERQLAVYSSVASSGARLALLPDDSSRAAEYLRFVQLYNGEFALIADDCAAVAAKEYYQRFIEFTEDPRRQERTQRAARRMAIAFRNALNRAQRTPLTRGQPVEQ